MLPGDNYRLKTTMAFDPYHLEDMKYRANYHYQITQNCLHLNDGNAEFAEVAQMAGVDATDWSWGALIFDFENDGNKDIFVSNGILKDIMSMDFLEFRANQARTRGKTDQRSFIAQIPAQPLSNYAFTHSGKLDFRNNAGSLGLGQPSFSNGAAYGDLDNDGDPDLVVNNINETPFVYRNDANLNRAHHFLKVRLKGKGSNPFGIGAEVMLKTREGLKVLQNYNTRGFQSSIEPLLLFGLGPVTRIDTLVVRWPGGKSQTRVNISTDQTITLDENEAAPGNAPSVQQPGPLYVEAGPLNMDPLAIHHENRYNDFDDEILLTRLLSTEGPRLITGDVNGDQLTDFILPGAAGDADKLFTQKTGGRFEFHPNPAFLKDASHESTCGVLLDYDGDGDPDLLVGSGGNEPRMNRANFLIRLYLNDGKGNFQTAPGVFPAVIGNFSTIVAADLDGDRDQDLFLGARNVPGNYGLPPRSYLLLNENGNWRDIASPPLANLGMVTDAVWADIDADGDNDLVVVGDWMAVHVFKNDKGFLNETSIANSEGWWTRIAAADLDQDGDLDFVLGNWGLNTKFKASAGKPLTMFVNDFDQNGKSEFIINWYPPLDAEAYPFAPKPELTSQLPALKKQILRYEDYGHKTYDSLFSAELRSRSLHYQVNTLQSSVLWNNNGQFELQALPLEAQVSPVFGILADDLDGDGQKDIWLGGNFYGLKPQAGRHNASRGVYLKGEGHRSFRYISPRESGIKAVGEVRDARVIEVKGKKYLLIARNNAGVLLFEKK
jgi:hypothetical protein